jgi:FixJ family two-component response regulator
MSGTEPTPAPAADDDGAPIVFVVDDEEPVRGALRRLLTSEGLAVQTFDSAQSFLAAFAATDAPSCLVLDICLPGLSGLALQQLLRSVEAPPAIVFLTGRGDIPTSVRAIKDGAFEFFTKPFLPADLVTGVKNALERERALGQARRQLSELERRYSALTPRERQVMAGVLAGQLNKQIAAEFGTREVTVKEQRAQVMRKMCAASAAELVCMGVQLGLVASYGHTRSSVG